MTTKDGAPRSAGLLVFRRLPAPHVLAGHMGGPFWARKQEGAWSFPKGLVEPGEDVLATALREFREETGLAPPQAPYDDLGAERQRSGKTVHLFAVEADLPLQGFDPGTFTMTRGDRSFEVPEIDRLEYLPMADARRLLVAGQAPFLGRLTALLTG